MRAKYKINHSRFRFSSVFIYMPEEQQAKAKTQTTTATTATTTTTTGTIAVRVFALATEEPKNDERHRQLVFSVFRIIIFSFPCRLFCVWACLVY